MILRPTQRLLTVLAALVASIAILLYAFAAPGTHAAKLHGDDIEIVMADGHPNSHGDHSHDEPDVAADTDASPDDHHHADHSHEKAELVRADSNGVHVSVDLDYSIAQTGQSEGPPYGIDRPPRPVTLS